MVRPAEDVALYTAEMAQWAGTGQLLGWQERQRDWVLDNNACRRDILDRLRTDGPLPQRELPDTCVRPWSSSGWNDNRNVTMMLDMLVLRGEVAVAGRTGRDKLWDLASRIYPDDPPVPLEEARRAPRRATAGCARHCPVEGRQDARRAGGRGRGRGARCGGRRQGAVAARPNAARAAVRGTGGTALAVRPPSVRPQTAVRDLRVRLPPRDVPARCQASVGATTPSRSSTATGWSGSSTRRLTARPGSCRSPLCTRTRPSARR